MAAQEAPTADINRRHSSESPFDDNAVIESHYESDSDDLLDEEPVKKEKNRRPPENNFSQQRLKAVNPVFTAATVIPMLILFGIIFVPIGGAMWLAAHRIEDLMIDYSHCETSASLDHWSPIPDKFVNYRFKNLPVVKTAQWKLETDNSQPFEDERQVCKIQFHVPHKIKGPLYFFYRLENFHQNHRRYAKSLSEEQIKGDAASVSTIKDTVGLNCEPLSVNSQGKRIYPCGLIANSLFNDTYGTTLLAVNGSSSSYTMTKKGIAWSGNKNRYKKTKYNYTEIVPPPNWYKMYPNGYNSTNVPDISQWEEFQNWMFTSAFPDFNKLAMRNDKDAIEEGIYEVTIGLHFPVLPYKGKKHIFISQRSAIGGKNYFMGWSWIAGGGVCLLMGVVLLAVNLIKPRKAGDSNLLSWNREKFAEDEKEEGVVGQ
ncbi:CIC11C00000000975 [Sungouiella intermedia]|uniref:CIC11C00000000975 n=1 Tax=Sungouiella intermedia TaxID=45354 RepID=A0A1L0BXV0_9ASCO|nr:CIC11C00000002370 [[Candida] intermedia]SGZ56076.1 CIC11C00000000975 [[Candida] intermedia]